MQSGESEIVQSFCLLLSRQTADGRGSKPYVKPRGPTPNIALKLDFTVFSSRNIVYASISRVLP